MNLDELRDLFKEEHRQAEDHIRHLLSGLDDYELSTVRDSVDQLNDMLGPHFQYEEDALYPALKEIHGRVYVKRLYDSHEGTIHTIRKLTSKLDENNFSQGFVSEARDLVDGWLLPHVSDCEGLSIVFEDLSGDQIVEIGQAREQALEDNRDLLEWADGHRNKPDFGTLTILN